jgi:hypothetical protein
VLWIQVLFRATCYYFRGAYYKAFFADPPACAVPGRLEWSALALAVLALLLGLFAGEVLELLRIGAPVEGPVLREWTP